MTSVNVLQGIGHYCVALLGMHLPVMAALQPQRCKKAYGSSGTIIHALLVTGEQHGGFILFIENLHATVWDHSHRHEAKWPDVP